MTQPNIPMLETCYPEKANEPMALKLHLYGQFVGSWHLDIAFPAAAT